MPNKPCLCTVGFGETLAAGGCCGGGNELPAGAAATRGALETGATALLGADSTGNGGYPDQEKNKSRRHLDKLENRGC
jgi:hypothetical protein